MTPHEPSRRGHRYHHHQQPQLHHLALRHHSLLPLMPNSHAHGQLQQQQQQQEHHHRHHRHHNLHLDHRHHQDHPSITKPIAMSHRPHVVGPNTSSRPLAGPNTMTSMASPTSSATITSSSSSTTASASSSSRKLQSLLLVAALCLFSSSFSCQLVEAIKMQPEHKEKYHWTGEQIVVTCQNNNNIKNVKIRWIAPSGLDVSEDKLHRVHAEPFGQHGNRLVIANATSQTDEGQYKCTIASPSDRSPREHIEFNLKLYKSTQFLDASAGGEAGASGQRQVLQAGRPGKLTCRVEFDPQVSSASVSWFHDSKPIDGGAQDAAQSGVTIVEYTAASRKSELNFASVSRSHDGVYTCQAVAETPQIFKVSDHKMRVEVLYGPQFDRPHETIWVERQPQQLRAGQAAPTSGDAQTTPAPRAKSQRKLNANRWPPATPIQQQQPQTQATSGGSTGSASPPPGVVRVELRCTCQSNPNASLLWYSTSTGNFELNKGEPGHVIDIERDIQSGHNTTSILHLDYSLEPAWPFRADEYSCTASNQLGSATKRFKIEQGDPAPQFNLTPHGGVYDPEARIFTFKLLGQRALKLVAAASAGSESPSSDENASPSRLPVDKLRIRAYPVAVLEQDQDSKYSANNMQTNSRQQQSYSSSPLPEPQASRIPSSSASSSASSASSSDYNNNYPAVYIDYNSDQVQFPHNVTVNLAKLPSGPQRLFLEAHNAVGWSPHSTFLGDYNLVSGAHSSWAHQLDGSPFKWPLMVSFLSVGLLLWWGFDTHAKRQLVDFRPVSNV